MSTETLRRDSCRVVYTGAYVNSDVIFFFILLFPRSLCTVYRCFVIFRYTFIQQRVRSSKMAKRKDFGTLRAFATSSNIYMYFILVKK